MKNQIYQLTIGFYWK